MPEDRQGRWKAGQERRQGCYTTMSWETRGKRGPYFTATRRVNGRQRRIYFGAGPVGELAAALQQERRLLTQRAREEEQAARRRWQDALQPLLDLCQAADRMSRAVLLAAGLHRHNRGQWRRVSMKKGAQESAGQAHLGMELEELVRLAEKGDSSALSILRGLVDLSSPLWREYADLGALAEDALVGLAAGENLLLAEALRQRVAGLREELAGPKPAPVERLLAERAALCWLEAHYLDVQTARCTGLGSRQAAELERRRQAAHGRYLAALRSLATVRRHLQRR